MYTVGTLGAVGTHSLHSHRIVILINEYRIDRRPPPDRGPPMCHDAPAPQRRERAAVALLGVDY